MKKHSLIPVALAAICCAGCTLIQVSHYMSPAAPGASYSRDPLGYDVASIYSGPPNALRLETDGVRLGFACWSVGYTPLLIGPFVFPVLPIVLLAPMVREPLETNRLRMALHIEPRGEPIGFTPGRLRVVGSQGDVLQISGIRAGPGSPPRINQSLDLDSMDEVATDQDLTIEEPTLFVFEVEATRQVGRSSFRVTIDGVTVRGSERPLPVVELTVASGLELQMAP